MTTVQNIEMGIVVDTETTTLSARTGNVVEIAIRVINLHTGESLGALESVVKLDEAEWAQASPSSLGVNGFTWKRVQEQGKPRSEIAGRIKSLFQDLNISHRNSFFLCQNPGFDYSFFSEFISIQEQGALGWPYHWEALESMHFARTQIVDGAAITSLSKDRIAEYYGLGPEAKPHRAMNGVDHAIQIYERIVGFPGKK